MIGNVAMLFGCGKSRICWRVVVEYIDRIFAGVESAFARLDFAVMGVGLADLELIAATLHVLVEALVARDDFCLFRFC